MAPATRRPHRKSRHGCQQCKKNRTKCDEQKPRCGRCIRTGAECSLLDPTSALIIISGPPAKPRPATDNMGLLSPPNSTAASEASVSDRSADQNILSIDCASYEPEFSDSERNRLKMMSFYTRLTSASIGDLTLGTQEGRSIWQAAIPDLAFKNDYLLHALLSVSALHIALTNPSLRHQHGILAIQHYNKGVALFTPHLHGISADNIDALFAFACLTALYSFGIHLSGKLQLSPLAKIHEVFTMIRGTCVIVTVGHSWLMEGIWAPWFWGDTVRPGATLPDDIEGVLQELQNKVGSTITTSTQSEMYTAAIESLRQNFVQAILVRPRNQCALVMLPLCAPPEYLQMLCIGEPLALAILANWGVILHWLRGHIWLQNWGRDTIKAVEDVVPQEWHSCIAWALKEVENPQDLVEPLSSSSVDLLSSEVREPHIIDWARMRMPDIGKSQ